MKSFTKHIILLIFLTVNLTAQDSYQFEFDYSQFYADSSTNLLEIYYEYDPSVIIERIDNDNSEVRINFFFQIVDVVDTSIAWSDTVASKYAIDELVSDKGCSKILGISKTLLPFGSYELSIYYISNDSHLELISTEQIEIKRMDRLKPVISNIQLAKSIKSDSSNVATLFLKNTLEVIPNPTSAYSSNSPLLKYYCELYNIGNQQLDFSTFLVSSASKVLYSKAKKINSLNNSIVQVDQINLMKYPSGVYTLQLVLSDSTNDYAFASKKQFYFYNKYYTIEQTTGSTHSGLLSSLFAYYSSEECDDIFEKSKYITTDIEKDQYNKLNTVEGKREFLFQFWVKQGKNSAQSPNTAYSDYMAHVDEAKKKFKEIRTDGYKTARGRIYLTYGEPSRTDSYANASNLKPYVVWYYDNIEGGVIFVFGDLDGFGNYELLHSTKRGEYFDENWESRLSIN